MYQRQRDRSFATAAQTINGVPFAAVSIPPAKPYRPNADDALGTPYATGARSNGSTMAAAAAC